MVCAVGHLRECASVGMEERQSGVGSYPDLSIAVLIDAAHVVAWQTVRITNLLLVVVRCPVTDVYHRHAVLAVAYVQVASTVVHRTAVAVRSFQLEVSYCQRRAVQMLYMSVAIHEPHTAVGSLCDVVHTRHRQSVFTVQMSCLTAIHVVHRQSTFRTDKHVVGAFVPVEGGDESVQRLFFHGYASLACNPGQTRLCCHPHVTLSVDSQ